LPASRFLALSFHGLLISCSATISPKERSQFQIVTRASKAWTPELIAAARPKVTQTYIDFSLPQSATGIGGKSMLELAAIF
jgi:hypothetical protein